MKRNVVLIVLDTVRQDYFAEHAERLQSMSDVTFTQCRAASSCSVPSHASILTGELPHRHGIHSTAVDYSKLREEDTFFKHLSDHRTIGVSTNTFAGKPFGFDTLFDEFVDISWTRRFPDGIDAREFVTATDASGLSFYTEFLKTALNHQHPLATLSNAALTWLDLMFSKLPVPKLLDAGSSAALKTAERRIEAGQEPFFLFVNLMEAHTPHQPIRGYDDSLYDVPSDWNSRDGLSQWEINQNDLKGHEEAIDYFRQLYTAAIDYLDRKVADFIERVQAASDHEVTFVITSDHGENLGYEADGTMVGHTSSLSEGLLHVPLTLVNPPEGYDSVERDYISHLKLGELVGGLADNQAPPDVTSDRIAAERITTTNTPDVGEKERRYWKRMLRCVYEDEQKWVWDSLGECIRYELDKERYNWQRKSSSEGSPPSWADGFFAESIENFRRLTTEESEEKQDLDDATKSRLEELGYL